MGARETGVKVDLAATFLRVSSNESGVHGGLRPPEPVVGGREREECPDGGLQCWTDAPAPLLALARS